MKQARLIVLCIVLTSGLTACSLLTIRTPDRPLPQRDLNARMLTREFAASFVAQVEIAADGIAARTADPALELNALRWKLGASKASQHAATQMAPLMALLDTWALSEQQRQFFDNGAGARLFGAEQDAVRTVATGIAQDAERLAQGVASKDELALYRAFVDTYVRDHPLTDLAFARTSVVSDWVAATNQQATLVDSAGTVSQAMSDVSERMRMFGERAPSHAVWQTQLALGESDLGSADFHLAFAHASDSLDRLTVLAESSPEQLRAGIADLRTSMFAMSDRFDASWTMMMHTVQEQREALATNVREEREAALQGFDAQRIALVKDAARITDQAIAAGGTQVRGLARELMIYGALLFVVVVGLPFAAGYFFGRLRGAHTAVARSIADSKDRP